ncbi:putative DNA binding domain-containing protein [Patescibacteria group bacterium]|nr:putative DNA binding domain-containing protein [Patescibacteria group bacterium]
MLNESETIEYKESLAEKESAGADIVAFANKEGGTLSFGIKNNGELKGIQEVSEKTVRELAEYFNGNIEPKLYPKIENIKDNGKNIIIITIEKSETPHHSFKGLPYIRSGPTSPKMSQGEYQSRLIKYKNINQDYSEKSIVGSSIKDLSVDALLELRRLVTQSKRVGLDISGMNDEQLLKNLRLINNNELTVAAIVLLGTVDALKKYLPYVEVRYGFRVDESQLRNQDTEIFQGGYLLYYNHIWQKINARNIILNIPQGLLLSERKAFVEETIREALNNAIIHRDYYLPEEIFIVHYQTKIIIKNPGGLIDGVNLDNILNESKTRNKLISDVLYKCDMIESFGTGVNLMFKNQLAIGKKPPTYEKSDLNHVVLELDGLIQDVEFAKYVLRVSDEKQKDLNDQELLLLTKIKNNIRVKANEALYSLLDLGLIEKIGYGKYILSRKYYDSIDKKGEYTRRRGLDKATNKSLIINHLKHHEKGYMKDIIEALKNVPKLTINKYLAELRNEGLIKFVGNPRISRGKNKGYWKLN